LAIAFAPLVAAALLVPRPSSGAAGCPPAGEGLHACLLTQSWLPWATLVVAVGVAVQVALWTAFTGLPGLVSRARDKRGSAQAAEERAVRRRRRVRTTGPAACGRCRRITPTTAFRCVCPACGGVAVRTMGARPGAPAVAWPR
jgi:hypothetical protein